MPDRFGLQKAVDETRGERFIILIEGTGRVTESSKPLTESDARKVLHKTGHAAALIESMVDHAKNSEKPHR